jgi:NADPH:quinone reductase-like Zn-dependent oxidoreductase
MKAEILRGLGERLWPAFALRAIKPVIHKTRPITRAEEAHAILCNPERLGKVVLTIEREE